MQSWTCVFAYTLAIASGNPWSPSTAAIRMSFGPPVLQLREHAQPELGSFGLADPEAQELLVPFERDGQGHVDGVVGSQVFF